MLKNSLATMAFWLFLPLAALQGVRLRRTAPRLPEAAGARTGELGQGETRRLLALGDSIIVGVGLESTSQSLPVQFAKALASTRQCHVQWRLEGKNGADIGHLRQQVRQVEPGQTADIIMISIGVNDVTGLISKRQWRRQCDTLLFELRQKWPTALVIFAGLPPMGKFPLPPQPLRFTLGRRAAELDKIARLAISKHPNMLHIPTEISPQNQAFCEDGFHPAAESCRFWAMELALRLEADKLHT